MEPTSKELEDVKVILDRLVYHHDEDNLPEDSPHAFIYFLTIRNLSDRTVTLLGRKWVIENDDGETLVIEGDKIVGKTPRLAPGEEFSYNSYHVTAVGGSARGSFHGVDEDNNRIHVRIPTFTMTIPENDL